MADSRCGVCGSVLSGTHGFCGNCGAPVGVRAPVAVGGTTASTPPVGPAPVGPSAAPPTMPSGPPPVPTGPSPVPTGPPESPSGPPPALPLGPASSPSPSPNRTWVALAALALVVALIVVVAVVATSDNKKSSTSAPTVSTTPPTATSTAPSLSTTTTPKTTVPSSTIPGGLTLSESCTSPDYGFSLDYPNGWFAEESFPGWQCALFNPSPFVVQPDTEVPPVAVLAAVYEYAFDPSVAMYTDPTYNELLSSNDETIDGHKAVAVEIVALQDGLEPAGTSRYAVLVEYGTDRTFVIETSSARGDDYTIDKQVVRAMANSLTIPG